MTSLIKNQVLKHLTKFFKDLAPEQLQLSAFKGSCELSNLQLEEKVLMELLSFPAWLSISKAACDQLSIKIPWTKMKSVPIQMNLNEVTVEVEVCEEFRDISSEADDMNLSTFINSQAPGKYGFVDRVIDGITVTVNNVHISFKSKIMSATFNLSRVILESRCPTWKPGELSLTRIKDINTGQILLFKIVEWQTMRLEAKCLNHPDLAPLRLITNHAQCRLTIKKKLDDCSVVAARIFVIFEDILWVLTFAQFVSAASFVEYIFTLIKKSPMSKKTGLLNDQDVSIPKSVNPVDISASNASIPPSYTATQQQAPLISPIHPQYQNAPAPILTGNLSSAGLTEQKFLCYDIHETSMHLFIDKIDAHLYDDMETSSTGSSSRDTGGALQTTFDQIQVDCYPYSRAISDRRHWFRWFNPSPVTRRQWISSHFAEFDLVQLTKLNGSMDALSKSPDNNEEKSKKLANMIPTSANEQLLSMTVIMKIKDYCMNCVATKHTARATAPNKFIHTDKDYHMPSEMPAIYLELNYYYYFDQIRRIMVYENVPDPLAFIHLSPTKLLFDSPTLLFLNSFQMNLSKALSHLNDLFPEDTTAPKIHCRFEILMLQLSLPAKVNNDQPICNTSALLVKSGKITLYNSIYDKKVLDKLMETIEKLRSNPNQPINFESSNQSNSSPRKEDSYSGDWNKVWNESLVNKISVFNAQSRIWAILFEPVWMDFMNYDVDELTSCQRLETMIEPVTAYGFIHLNLGTPLTSEPANSFSGANDSEPSLSSLSMMKNDRQVNPCREGSSPNSQAGSQTGTRNIMSILVSILDSSIVANMDKVQFSFLQRLGIHVEKLFQQIRADASSIIELDSTVEGSFEINLTAYIKEIKARLILDKKVEPTALARDPKRLFDTSKLLTPSSNTGKSAQNGLGISENGSSGYSTTNTSQQYNFFDSNIQQSVLSNPFADLSLVQQTNHSANVQQVFPAEQLAQEESSMVLDDCVEVADDASCLFFANNDNPPAKCDPNPTVLASANRNEKDLVETSSTTGVTSSAVIINQQPSSNKNPIEESLLINLDEMEQSSSLFATVGSRRSSPQPPAARNLDSSQSSPAVQKQQREQNRFETESISYLELSMSQLMVRRITETKRRQKF